MSSESFKAFTNEIQNNEAIQKDIRDASDENGVSMEKLAGIAADHGYEFTVEDATNELSDAQLEGVAGGLARMDLNQNLNFKVEFHDISGDTYLKFDGKIDGIY